MRHLIIEIFFIKMQYQQKVINLPQEFWAIYFHEIVFFHNLKVFIEPT